MLEGVIKRVKEQGIILEITEDAKKFIVQKRNRL